MAEKLITLEEIKKTPPGNTPEIAKNISELDDINSRLKDAEKKLVDIEKSAEEAQSRVDRASTFIMWIIGAIALVFLAIIIQVSLDYFNNNEERYEKFINRASEIEKNVYSKEELQPSLEEIKNITKIFNCMKAKGYFSVKCFKE